MASVMKRFLRECGRLLSTGSFMEKFVVIAGLRLIPDVAFRYPHLRSEGLYGAVMMGIAGSLLDSLFFTAFFTAVWHLLSKLGKRRE